MSKKTLGRRHGRKGRRYEVHGQFEVDENHRVLSADRPAVPEALPGRGRGGNRGQRDLDTDAGPELALLPARHQRADEPLHADRGDILLDRQTVHGVRQLGPALGLSGDDVRGLPAGRPARRGRAPGRPGPVHVRVRRAGRALVVRDGRVVRVAVLRRGRVRGRAVRGRRAPVPVQRAQLRVPGHRGVLRPALPAAVRRRDGPGRDLGPRHVRLRRVRHIRVHFGRVPAEDDRRLVRPTAFPDGRRREKSVFFVTGTEYRSPSPQKKKQIFSSNPKGYFT